VLALFTAVATSVFLLALLIGGLAMLRPGGRGRAARFAAFALTYLGAEIVGLSRGVWLWAFASPRGDARRRVRYEDAHYALLDRLLGTLWAVGRRAFRVQVRPPEPADPLPEGPLLVFSRHAGPGDSFLLVYALLDVIRRRPHVVLKRTLILDPAIDLILSRTPNCFVGHSEREREQATECIARLSGSLGPRDALLIFPEGGNFTVARRSRLIERLRQKHEWRLVPTARSLEHVLPPQPSGIFAAIDAAVPGSTVVFVAHTGLDQLETVAQVWRSVPLDSPLEVAWWTCPVDQVPSTQPERDDWLSAHWSRIDEWIDGRQRRSAVSGVDVVDSATVADDVGVRSARNGSTHE
jgi:1-acyl-sn-glycerol-3-phosphate acyltransferase